MCNFFLRICYTRFVCILYEMQTLLEHGCRRIAAGQLQVGGQGGLPSALLHGAPALGEAVPGGGGDAPGKAALHAQEAPLGEGSQAPGEDRGWLVARLPLLSGPAEAPGLLLPVGRDVDYISSSLLPSPSPS